MQRITSTYTWLKNASSHGAGLWIKRLLQLAVLLLLIYFITQYLADQYDQIREEPLEPDWPALIAAQMGLIVGLALLSVPNLLIVRALGGQGFGWLAVCRFFFISNIAKYLPGSLWALPGRMYLYQRAGLPLSNSIVAVFWEVLFMVISSALMALLGWRFLDHYLPAELLFAGLALGLIALTLLFVILASDTLQKRALGLPIPLRIKTQLQRPELWLSASQAATVLLLFMLGWLVIGLSVSGMVYAVSERFEAIWWLELTGLYLGTWLVGFLIFFTPGGIGVRDVLLALGISLILADPLPGVVAVLARITWTLAEVIGTLLLNLLYLRWPALFQTQREV